MSQDLPRTGNQVIDTATKVFAWLGKHIDQLNPRPPAPPPPAPAEMTDKQLHHAIHDIGAHLLTAPARSCRKASSATAHQRR